MKKIPKLKNANSMSNGENKVNGSECDYKVTEENSRIDKHIEKGNKEKIGKKKRICPTEKIEYVKTKKNKINDCDKNVTKCIDFTKEKKKKKKNVNKIDEYKEFNDMEKKETHETNESNKKKKEKEKEKEKEKDKREEKEGIAKVIKMNYVSPFNWFSNNDTQKKDKLIKSEGKLKYEKGKEELSGNSKKNKEKDTKINAKKEFGKRNELHTVENAYANDICKPIDFERLLASAKNSSAAWISYISYYIEKGNLNEARKIAERALKSIDIDKTDEKLNVFLCYINMECLYGNRLNEIFKRALIYNDEKKIYLHMIHILKKNNKLKQLKEICEDAIKKFKNSKKIWICYLEVLHNTLKDEETAHEVLLKSLHNLPKRKHLHMIISAARFEYKYSNKERGKAYFEKLIVEFPKRSDIWFTYIDVHISSLLKRGEYSEKNKRERKKKMLNTSELESVRNIFERFITHKFKPRVMKMIFTKWLFFEKNHGSQYHEKMVQQKAFHYVESLQTDE